MKASIRRKYGPPSSIRVEDIEKPVPKENEVLIKIIATTCVSIFVSSSASNTSNQLTRLN